MKPVVRRRQEARGETILFVDGSQGASGDMLLGALVDAGASLAAIRRELATLPIDGYAISSRRLVRAALAGRQVRVRVRGGEQPDRNWREVRAIVVGGRLAPRVRERALAIFRRLFEAEAEVHGQPFDRVHLHEAGGVDAIVDIVGVAIALESLGVGRVVVSPLVTGFGTVRCAHGVYPVPAPATALLLRGVPARGGDIEAERLTPTGAAILTTLADEWSAQPPMRATHVGYGAGSLDLGSCPNMLRVTLGRSLTADAADAPEIGVIEWTVDDTTPQSVAHAAERLLALGALDVTTGPVVMKKGRSGHHVTMLVPSDRIVELAIRAVELTSTLGVRYRVERRLELDRRIERVRTPFGPVSVKVGRLGDRVVHGWPEYDDCARLAERHGVALWDIQEAALVAWRTRPGTIRRPRKPAHRTRG